MRPSLIFLLIVLGAALMNCSLSDPLTGGAVAPVPDNDKGNETSKPSASTLATPGSSVSVRVFVSAVPSQ